MLLYLNGQLEILFVKNKSVRLVETITLLLSLFESLNTVVVVRNRYKPYTTTNCTILLVIYKPWIPRFGDEMYLLSELPFSKPFFSSISHS